MKANLSIPIFSNSIEVGVLVRNNAGSVFIVTNVLAPDLFDATCLMSNDRAYTVGVNSRLPVLNYHKLPAGSVLTLEV